MLRNLLRIYTKFSIIILSLILFLPITKIAAHSPTDSPWLYINEVAVIVEMENKIPNPSKLDWGEHVFSGELKKNENLKPTVDLDVIERDLEVEKSNISMVFTLKNPDGNEETFTEFFTKKLELTGNYFLEILLERKDNKKEIISESIMLVVGDKEEPSVIKVNGEVIDNTSAAPRYYVTDNYNLKFEINNPGDYNYTWDLGTGETKDGSAFEYSFDKAKIPVYVVLRKQNKATNVFVESYVRIDSQRENTFGIPRPPVKIPDEVANTNSFPIIAVVVVITLIVLSIGAFVILRKRK